MISDDFRWFTWLRLFLPTLRPIGARLRNNRCFKNFQKWNISKETIKKPEKNAKQTLGEAICRCQSHTKALFWAIFRSKYPRNGPIMPESWIINFQKVKKMTSNESISSFLPKKWKPFGQNDLNKQFARSENPQIGQIYTKKKPPIVDWRNQKISKHAITTQNIFKTLPNGLKTCPLRSLSYRYLKKCYLRQK